MDGIFATSAKREYFIPLSSFVAGDLISRTRNLIDFAEDSKIGKKHTGIG